MKITTQVEQLLESIDDELAGARERMRAVQSEIAALERLRLNLTGKRSGHSPGRRGRTDWVAVIAQNPGKTVRELAEIQGRQPQHVHAVLRRLRKSGRIVRRGDRGVRRLGSGYRYYVADGDDNGRD